MTQVQDTKQRDANEEAIRFALYSANEHGVRFIRLWFTDILGTLKGFAITVDELEDVLRGGASFDGASIEGLAREGESDMVAMPDPSTWQVLPWRPRENAVARIFCDIKTAAGKPADTDNREVLRRVLRKAGSLGFTYYVAPEIEYYHLKSSEDARPYDAGGYFDQSSDNAGADLRRKVVIALEEMGIPVKHSHHEVSDGQHEIDLRHTNALTMADSIITFKVAVKELAAHNGGYATFMPRPFQQSNGSGMHTHMSLFKGDSNAFYDPSAPGNLSEVARQFLAGLVRHAPEITAVTNQWVNSYKRLVPGLEAPIFASYTSGNMSDLVRVPTYRPGKEDSVRIEYRAPDSACNPYLAFAAILAAGLEGIEQGYELAEPIKGNPFNMSSAERKAHGVNELPTSLDSALKLASESDLLRKALGPTVMESFIRNKTLEWADYSQTVTDFEKSRYLKML
jgi:glutamine synthetase